MNKRVCLSLLFSILALLGYSQQVTGGDESMPVMSSHDTIDYAKLCAHYKIWAVRDASADEKKYRTHEMILQIGEKVSKFCDYFYFQNDSATFSEMKSGLNKMVIFANQMSRARIAKRYYYEQVFKNFPEGNNTVLDNIVIKTYKYNEEMPNMNWTIVSENTDTILGYVCGKATCEFRGRTYTAWYAPDIPVDDGPWKFHGLPGLILKVREMAKDYYWLCTALYQPTWKSPISIKTEVKKTTYIKYHKAKKRAEEDPNALHANDPNAKIRTPNGEWVLASELNKGKYRPPYTPKELDW